MGQELCAKRLQPACNCYHRSEGGEAHSCLRRQPGSAEAAAALEVFVSREEHLSLLVNQAIQTDAPFCTRV